MFTLLEELPWNKIPLPFPASLHDICLVWELSLGKCEVFLLTKHVSQHAYQALFKWKGIYTDVHYSVMQMINSKIRQVERKMTMRVYHGDNRRIHRISIIHTAIYSVQINWIDNLAIVSICNTTSNLLSVELLIQCCRDLLFDVLWLGLGPRPRPSPTPWQATRLDLALGLAGLGLGSWFGHAMAILILIVILIVISCLYSQF